MVDTDETNFILLPCTCGDVDHVLKLSTQFDYVWVEVSYPRYLPLKIRLKHAWHMLRERRDYTYHSEIVLDPTSVDKAKDFLLTQGILRFEEKIDGVLEDLNNALADENASTESVLEILNEVSQQES